MKPKENKNANANENIKTRKDQDQDALHEQTDNIDASLKVDIQLN